MTFLSVDESYSNSWFLQTTDQRISDFLKLPQGWHYGEGNAPNEETVDDALRINNQATLLGLRTEAFPSINGEIKINCYFGHETLEFTIGSTNRALLVEEESDSEISSQDNLTVEGVLNIIKEECGKPTWNSFDQSTQSIIVESESDLTVWRSKIPLTEAEYLSYPVPA